MAEITQKDIKRLFAESKNLCAFPKCTTNIVVEGSVVGEICHIRAKNPGGPRYLSTQPDKERNSYPNPILLCSVHHKVIDDDEDSYTVDRLNKIKSNHINQVSDLPVPSLDDAQLKQLVYVKDVVMNNGSIITTVNQSGGQVAHSITNISPPKRELTTVIEESMLQVLQANAKGKIAFASTQGDTEASNWKTVLMKVFENAGWEVVDSRTFMFFGDKRGLVITIQRGASGEGLPQVIAHALSQTIDPLSCNRGDMANGYDAYIQVWSAAENT